MKAKKLFPELTFKRLWNKITGVDNKFDKEVNEINKKFEWKFAGSVTGTTHIVTPKNFRELLIDIKCPTSDRYTMAYSFIFNKKQIENGADYFNGGAIGESKLLVQITVNLENIILRTLVFTTNNITDTATVSCYYR